MKPAYQAFLKPRVRFLTDVQYWFKTFENLFRHQPVKNSTEALRILPWYSGKHIEELPGYLFWPAEKRYSKVLWWGMCNDGLYFIEKGLGYKQATPDSNFLPAEEEDYYNSMLCAK